MRRAQRGGRAIVLTVRGALAERKMQKRRTIALLLGLLALLVAGCTDSLRWTEDVRLPDGRVVVLQRYTEFAERGGIAESFQRIEFNHPMTGQVVVWENSRNVKDRIHGGILAAIALFESGGRMFLLAKPGYGNDDFYFKCPNPPYLLFEHGAGGWVPRPLAQIPVQRLSANLTSQIRNDTGPAALKRGGGHLTVAHTGNQHVWIRDERGAAKSVPYVMDFAQQPEQTFRAYQGCDQPRNKLIVQ